jgi:N-glycosylase/DNA lyase
MRSTRRAGEHCHWVADIPNYGNSAPIDDAVALQVKGDLVTFRWGKPWLIGTAAFWVDQAELGFVGQSHEIGSTIEEEVAACILGGFGMPAEVALAAYRHLRAHGAFEHPEANRLEALLREPLRLPTGRLVNYRFPRQRAQRLETALRQCREAGTPPQEGVALRDWLLSFTGIGPKTASWIARNRTGCDDVAIIDVHVRRAGEIAGFFPVRWRLPTDYFRYEGAFLEVARLGGVSAAALDACIWGLMHRHRSLRRLRIPVEHSIG